MSRCMYCDYSPTAPSVSAISHKGGINLTWDKVQRGWHCNGRCSDYDPADDIHDPYLKEELVEVVEVKAPVSET